MKPCFKLLTKLWSRREIMERNCQLIRQQRQNECSAFERANRLNWQEKQWLKEYLSQWRDRLTTARRIILT
jgi:hypothetical protein